jgi:hypothetical protein
MKDAWTVKNDNRVITWNAQLKRERAQREEREASTRGRTPKERDAEEQRWEIERKKTKRNLFDPNRSWIEPKPRPAVTPHVR